MELRVLETAGLPEDVILAVRAGTVRRQESLPSSRPFPLPPAPCPVQVEVHKWRAWSRTQGSLQDLSDSDGGSICSIALSSNDGSPMRITFRAEEPHPSSGGKAGAASHGMGMVVEDMDMSYEKEANIEAYLKKHKLHAVMNEMFRRMMTERPKEPYAFIGDWLRRTSATLEEPPAVPTPASPCTPPRRPPSTGLDAKETPMEKPLRSALASSHGLHPASRRSSSAHRRVRMSAETLRQRLLATLAQANLDGTLSLALRKTGTHQEAPPLTSPGSATPLGEEEDEQVEEAVEVSHIPIKPGEATPLGSDDEAETDAAELVDEPAAAQGSGLAAPSQQGSTASLQAQSGVVTPPLAAGLEQDHGSYIVGSSSGSSSMPAAGLSTAQAEEIRQRLESEISARQTTEEATHYEAEVDVRLEAERNALEAIELKAKLEAERKLRERAEQDAKEKAEMNDILEAERKAHEAVKLEAERKLRERAAQKAKEEAEESPGARCEEAEMNERQLKRSAELKAKDELEHQVVFEAERQERENAEQRAREEAEMRARLEEERLRRERAEQQAREEAEQDAKEKAEMNDILEAERKAHEAVKLEAERKLRERAAQKAKEEAEEAEMNERQLKRSAELKAKDELEHQVVFEAERQERENAEQRAREEAEMRARLEEEQERLRRERAEQQAREEAEMRARLEEERLLRERAEQHNREEAEIRARLEEERLLRERAEQQARKEAEMRARLEEEHLRRERAEQQAREEAEVRARLEEKRLLRERAEQQAREEADMRARLEQERLLRDRAEQQARKEAEMRARLEEERLRRERAEQQAREEAEVRARLEEERCRREEAERKVKEDAEMKARLAIVHQERKRAEQRAAEDAAMKARAEQQAKEEAEMHSKLEAERQLRERAEQQARDEADMNARLEEKVKEDAEMKEKVVALAEQAAREVAEREAKVRDEREAQQRKIFKAREEAERISQEAEDLKAELEEERKLRERAELRANEEAARRAEVERKALEADRARQFHEAEAAERERLARIKQQIEAQQRATIAAEEAARRAVQATTSLSATPLSEEEEEAISSWPEPMGQSQWLEERVPLGTPLSEEEAAEVVPSTPAVAVLRTHPYSDGGTNPCTCSGAQDGAATPLSEPSDVVTPAPACVSGPAATGAGQCRSPAVLPELMECPSMATATNGTATPLSDDSNDEAAPQHDASMSRYASVTTASVDRGDDMGSARLEERELAELRVRVREAVPEADLKHLSQQTLAPPSARIQPGLFGGQFSFMPDRRDASDLGTPLSEAAPDVPPEELEENAPADLYFSNRPLVEASLKASPPSPPWMFADDVEEAHEDPGGGTPLSEGSMTQSCPGVFGQAAGRPTGAAPLSRAHSPPWPHWGPGPPPWSPPGASTCVEVEQFMASAEAHAEEGLLLPMGIPSWRDDESEALGVPSVGTPLSEASLILEP